MTICNMTIEGGGRAGMIAPDETTFAWVREHGGEPCEPRHWRDAAHRRRRDVRQARSSSTSPRSARWSPGARTRRWSSASPTRVPEPQDDGDERALDYMGLRPARRCRRSSSTACSSARARTRGSATCARPPTVVKGRKVASRRLRDGRPRLRAGEGAGRGRGPRRGLPRGRLRLARRGLLDVPGHEPRHRRARRALRLDLEPQLRGPPGQRRPHRTSSAPQMAAAAAIEGHFVDIRDVELSHGADRDHHGRVSVLDARRRRHRPDHPQAVPQAGRADGLRRVPLLRLGEGARLGPAGQPDPRHRAQLRLRLQPRARARGRWRTTASARSSRRRFADIFRSNCTKIGLLPVQLTAERRRGDRRGAASARSTSPRRRSAGRAARAHFEIDPDIKHRLLNGLDDIALTLQQDDGDRRVRGRARAAVEAGRPRWSS